MANDDLCGMCANEGFCSDQGYSHKRVCKPGSTAVWKCDDYTQNLHRTSDGTTGSRYRSEMKSGTVQKG